MRELGWFYFRAMRGALRLLVNGLATRSVRDEIDRAIGLTLQNFHRVDVWVNNAGVGIRDSVAEMETTALRELFETNFFGTIACMQAVIPVMRLNGGRGERAGSIINISSVAGHIPVPFMAIYSASKFAMNAIGKGARMELKRDNINVLTVCPGYINTDFGAHVVADRKEAVRPPTARGITAERVARATYRGYRANKREVVVPWTMIPAIKLYQLFPGLVEWVLGRAMRKAG
jgi:short-subunit dehydrogenase